MLNGAEKILISFSLSTTTPCGKNKSRDDHSLNEWNKERDGERERMIEKERERGRSHNSPQRYRGERVSLEDS